MAVRLCSANYPLYAVTLLDDSHILVAGGGGAARTGVENAMEIFELQGEGKNCVATSLHKHSTDPRAVMSLAAKADGKGHLVAAGMDGKCQLFRITKSKEASDEGEQDVDKEASRVNQAGKRGKKTGEREGGKRGRRKRGKKTKSAENEANLRKRKGSTGNKAEKSAEVTEQSSEYKVESLACVDTDFHKEEPFQKVVRFSRDGDIIATGGADGHVRVWKVPKLEKKLDIKAHLDEIDDLDISPSGNKIVSVSRDYHAYVWKVESGKREAELHWDKNVPEKSYRIKAVRFGTSQEKKSTVQLYTMHIPARRERKPLPCYLTKWDAMKFVPVKTQSTGTELLSSLAVSDDGVFLGVGTNSGDTMIYVSWSLQKVHRVSEAHGIFVTGLCFLKNNAITAELTKGAETALVSVSADHHVNLTPLRPRFMVSVWFAVIGFLVLVVVVMIYLGQQGLI
ncbi:prolactin regulatory element-binding protein-like isoform X1 [Branchiostoma floridae]|uniref:Prolactin regulatory element-binding protein-like isoform X1 n=1 Tax=Branchiostoma floridae TaxID=7739 RepID=A0A9J7KLP3_BRAFL|nr:prolactin regulatory element-binding protein-like isoform X1 [Branchiostoma floridae]